MVGGSYFTGLLLQLKAGDAVIGTISMLSFLGNVPQFLAPLFLERFQHRKRLLIGIRALLHILNIAAIGIIPFMPTTDGFRVGILLATLLTFSLINALTAPGYQTWHIQSIPVTDRADYFTLSNMLIYIVVFTTSLGAGFFVDLYKSAGMELLGLTILRGFALGLGVIDLAMLTRIMEYPYESSEPASHPLAILLRPFRERKYLTSVIIACAWSFVANVPGPYVNVYMLKDLGVSYFFLNIVNIVSVPALLFIAPVWRKQVERFSWRGTLTIAVGLYFPHLFVLGFVTRETLFLYPIAMISAILVSPGINLVMANMAYMNLPERDQTAYIGLYVSLNSLAAFLGSAVGASFILSTSNLHFEIGGMLLGNKQLLLVITGVMMALYVLAMMSRSGKNSK